MIRKGIPVKTKMVLVLAFVLVVGTISLLAQERKENLQKFFGSGKEYSFLQGIEAKIETAKKEQNVRLLGAYACLLFYAQNLSGKQKEKWTGTEILREATSLAWEHENIQELMILEALWASKIFGPDDPNTAEEIKKQIEALKEKQKAKNIEENIFVEPTPGEDNPPADPNLDPQKFLSAEEYARVDAVQQLAEQVFGVMVQSSSDVKNFTLEKDVVVAELQSQLMLGARFGKTVAHGKELQVPVMVDKNSVILALKQTLASKKKKMSKAEWIQLESTLQEEYHATGMGIVED